MVCPSSSRTASTAKLYGAVWRHNEVGNWGSYMCYFNYVCWTSVCLRCACIMGYLHLSLWSIKKFSPSPQQEHLCTFLMDGIRVWIMYAFKLGCTWPFPSMTVRGCKSLGFFGFCHFRYQRRWLWLRFLSRKHVDAQDGLVPAQSRGDNLAAVKMRRVENSQQQTETTLDL